jgi:ADP-ribose pyrophosphatase
MNRHPDIELLSAEVLHRGRVFDVHREALRLPSGLRQEIELVAHPGAVCVAPLLPSGELLLVRQYRHAAGEWLIELPAGRLEAGEPRELAARRELEEETGQRAAQLELLAEFYAAPGFCSEWLSLYLASGLSPAGPDVRAHDADEELELVRMAPERVLREARDAKTLLAALLVLRSSER